MIWNEIDFLDWLDADSSACQHSAAWHTWKWSYLSQQLDGLLLRLIQISHLYNLYLGFNNPSSTSAGIPTYLLYSLSDSSNERRFLTSVNVIKDICIRLCVRLHMDTCASQHGLGSSIIRWQIKAIKMNQKSWCH